MKQFDILKVKLKVKTRALWKASQILMDYVDGKTDKQIYEFLKQLSANELLNENLTDKEKEILKKFYKN